MGDLFYQVTAPFEADETVFEYLANTPLVYLAVGTIH